VAADPPERGDAMIDLFGLLLQLAQTIIGLLSLKNREKK